jgi:hypothetical protein
VSKDEPDPVQQLKKVLEESGFEVTLTYGTRWRRCLRWMTSPWRIIAGIPIAFFLDWLNSSGHHLTQGGFWEAYISWFPAIFIVFWLFELHAWAGGRRLDG